MNMFDWASSLPGREERSLRVFAGSFVTSERGTMTIFALFMLMIIFAAAGFAVDVMRYDRERARLQYALDRAVLAAADLDQDLCPKDVVIDYLEKEGLDQYLVGEPKVEPNVCGSTAVTIEGYRRVEASAQMDIGMHFMQWWDVDSIASAATSVAEEAIDDVEISLVLDVSGSMNSYNRLTNLKVAAQNFVQEMADKTEDGKLSISIIPYATQVTLPDYLMDELNVQGTNPFGNCINFEDSDFTTTTFDLAKTYERTMHFTHWGDYDRRPSNKLVYSEICETSENREVMVLQKDPAVLKQKIQSFKAGGNTSIELGLKWGIALLDESFQPLIAKLAGDDLPAEFARRPHTYASGDAMKVLVLMTDGANTTQYQVNPPYRGGTSNIWWNDDAEVYSFLDVDAGNYIWPDIAVLSSVSGKTGKWIRSSRQSHPYGNGTYRRYKCTSYSGSTCYNVDYDKHVDLSENGEAVELDWPDVWQSTTRYKIYDMLRDAFGSSYAYDWYYDAVTSTGPSKKDPRAETLCAKAKDQDIIIFSIAFEAPSAGKALLKKCKSDDGAYYEATGDEIVDVFASIGSTIRNLRLTQ